MNKNFQAMKLKKNMVSLDTCEYNCVRKDKIKISPLHLENIQTTQEE